MQDSKSAAPHSRKQQGNHEEELDENPAQFRRVRLRYSDQSPEPKSSQATQTQEQNSSSSHIQLVMPDRMQWFYRDPSGNTQGPWSGLEMHDWYKAEFFPPELQVKKLEEEDFEPLARLVRRIGNSREPFLVPQYGIPYGSSAPIPSSTTATSGTVPATTPSATQPPFTSSFSNFGITLSAKQQNAMERRKEEEEYLMARQKEHLAQQRVMLKHMQHMGDI